MAAKTGREVVAEWRALVMPTRAELAEMIDAALDAAEGERRALREALYAVALGSITSGPDAGTWCWCEPYEGLPTHQPRCVQARAAIRASKEGTGMCSTADGAAYRDAAEGVERAGQRVLDDEPRLPNGARGVSPNEYLRWRDDESEPARQVYETTVTANADAMSQLRAALATLRRVRGA